MSFINCKPAPLFSLCTYYHKLASMSGAKVVLGIVGYRYFENYEYVKSEIDKWIKEENFTPDLIISGGCKGVDKLGERYARENKIQLYVYKPDWKKYPVSKHRYKAFGERDKQIAQNCTHLIAFPSSKHGKGTQLTVSFARKNNKMVLVRDIDDIELPKTDDSSQDKE